MQYNLNNIYIKIILGVCFTLLAMESNSQQTVKPRKVEVTYNKTSSIVFPAIIKSVDRGSRDILAQKAKGVDNVLQLKAGKQNFAETNLTVITGDGILHQFTLNYSDKPASLSVDLSGDSLQNAVPLIFQTEMTETEMENYSTGIVQTKRTVRSISENKYKISIALLSIYIKDDVMFYRFKIRNRSNIHYTIDFLKFYIRDQTKIKRTASQEVVVKPIYVFGNDKEVKGKSEADVVYALEKFTIPESKHLDVEMFEHNGGRHFYLIIKNKTIVNARLLP
jgi:conjugative transposon TraN protein